MAIIFCKNVLWASLGFHLGALLAKMPLLARSIKKSNILFWPGTAQQNISNTPLSIVLTTPWGHDVKKLFFLQNALEIQLFLQGLGLDNYFFAKGSFGYLWAFTLGPFLKNALPDKRLPEINNSPPGLGQATKISQTLP